MLLRTTLLIVALSAVRADIYDAVAQDSMEAIKKELTANPESLNQATGPGGQSPLMHAVLTGKTKAVKYLLRRKADPAVAEKDGYTPMHGVRPSCSRTTCVETHIHITRGFPDLL